MKKIKACTKRAIVAINMVGAVVLARVRLLAAKGCVRAFFLAYKRPWTGLQDVVHLEVRRQSINNVRIWLERNRIRHCALCLSIDRPLRQAEDHFECDRHVVPAKA